MLKSLLLLTLLAGMNVHAQPENRTGETLEQDAAQLAREIRNEAPYLNSEQRVRIADLIKDIRGTIYNNPISTNDYVCVSRDNDGKNPFALGLRSGVNVAKINNAIYATSDDCKIAAKNIRSVRKVALVCATRDADGRNPWSVGLLDGRGGMRMLAPSSTSTLNECIDALKNAIVSSQQVIFCTSRDNDARAPFIPVSVNAITGEFTAGNTVYSNMNDCKSFVGVQSVK